MSSNKPTEKPALTTEAPVNMLLPVSNSGSYVKCGKGTLILCNEFCGSVSINKQLEELMAQEMSDMRSI